MQQPLTTTNSLLAVEATRKYVVFKEPQGANNQLTINPNDTKSLLCDPESCCKGLHYYVQYLQVSSSAPDPTLYMDPTLLPHNQ